VYLLTAQTFSALFLQLVKLQDTKLMGKRITLLTTPCSPEAVE